MSFGNYTAFGTSLATWLRNDNAATITDIGVTMVSDLITVGENRLFREARTRDMEVSMSTSIGSGVVAVPSGYVAMKNARIDTSPVQRLERRNADWIYDNYPLRSADGQPVYFARDGTNFIFGPYPDSSYTFACTYYKHLTAISGAALNALFTANPDLYLFACLAEGDMVLGRDSRIQIWEAKYQRILMDVNGEEREDTQSGSALQMRVSGGATRMRTR